MKFLVEAYAPGTSELAELVAEAQAAAHDGARHLRSIFVPEDEICLHLFECASADAVGLNGRVVEAIEHPA
jgi:hypothetical protein